MLSFSAFFDDNNDPFLNETIQQLLSPSKQESLSDQDETKSDISGDYGISDLLKQVNRRDLKIYFNTLQNEEESEEMIESTLNDFNTPNEVKIFLLLLISSSFLNNQAIC